MKKALLTIFVGVTTAILIFVIKRALTPDPPPAAIVVDGQIVDGNRQLLENVSVHLHVLTVDESQKSDSEGRYKFSIEGFKPTDVGVISAEAPGYKRESLNLTVLDMSVTHSIVLTAVPNTPAPPTGLVIAHPAIARYVARPDAKLLAKATVK